MPSIYGNAKKTNTTTSKSSNFSVEELESLAQSQGLKPPKPKQAGFLSKILGGLTSFETAPLVYSLMSGDDPLSAIGGYGSEIGKGLTGKGLSPDKKTYDDVLELIGMPKGKVRSALGFVGDVGLDPTTYVGGSLLKQIGRGAGKVIKPLAKTRVGKVGQKVVDVFGRAFTPRYDVKKLGKEGKLYDEMVNELHKLTRAQQGRDVDKIVQLKKQIFKKYGDDGLRQVQQGLEKGVKRGTDKEILDVVKELRTQNINIASVEKKVGVLRGTRENYMPHILTEDAKELLGKYGRGPIKKILDRLGAAKKRGYEGSADAINKEFFQKNKKLIYEMFPEKKAKAFKLFEEDPFKAQAVRSVESARATHARMFLDDVERKFGKRGVETEFIDGVKYVPFQPDGSLRFFPLEDLVGKKVMGVSKKAKTYLLPEPIAKDLNEMMKVFTQDETTQGFLKHWDKINNWWKGSVTVSYPAFHTRNFMGGVFNNFIAGLKNPARYIQGHNVSIGKAGTITLKSGKTMSFDEIRRLAQDLGILGHPGQVDLFKNIDEAVAQGLETSGQKTARYLNPLKLPSNLMEGGKKAMGWVENRVRLPLFIEELIQGKSAKDAAQQVFKYHFDYAPEAATAFEKGFLKRVIPFYTWARNNIPLQLSEMLKQPGKYAGIGKAWRDASNIPTQEELAKLPDYMREQFPIKIGEKGDKSMIAYGLGLPLEDIGETFAENPFSARTGEKLMGRLSPMIKTPIETLAKRHFFFGKPLGDVNFVYPFVAKIPLIREFIGAKEQISKDGETYYISTKPEMLNIFNSAVGRLYTTLGKITNEDMTLMAKIIYSTFGIKARSVNFTDEEYYRERDRIRTLEEFLQREGILKKFERYFKPKQ